jgi:hypothetical protein
MSPANSELSVALCFWQNPRRAPSNKQTNLGNDSLSLAQEMDLLLDLRFSRRWLWRKLSSGLPGCLLICLSFHPEDGGPPVCHIQCNKIRHSSPACEFAALKKEDRKKVSRSNGMSCNNSYVDAMTPRCPAGVVNSGRVTRQLSQSLQVQNIPRASFTTTAPTVENIWKCCSKRWILIHFIYYTNEDASLSVTRRCCKDNGLYYQQKFRH